MIQRPSTGATITLQALLPEHDRAVVVVLPRTATVQELKYESCVELGVSAEDVTLWDYFGGHCYAPLEDRLQTTLANARLMDRQAILLKGRDGRPPSLISFVSTVSKPPDTLLTFDDGSQLAVHRSILELSSPLLQDILAQSPQMPTSQDDALDNYALISHPSTEMHREYTAVASFQPGTPTNNQAPRAVVRPWPPSHDEQVLPGPTHRLAGAVNRDHSAGSSWAEWPLQTSNSQSSSGSVSGQNASAPMDIQTEAQSAPSKAHPGFRSSTHGCFVLKVPGDERYSWVYVLQLLYPCCQMRRPPITWHNIHRILALADKWIISSVLRVCEDFLLMPSSQLSLCPSDPAYVWRWLITADRLNMQMVVRKCIAFVQRSCVTIGYDRGQLDQAITEVVKRCSPAVVTQLITGLCAYKDELLTVNKT